MHDRVSTYQELTQKHKTCPVCLKDLDWSTDERGRGIRCTFNNRVHYLIRFRSYRHNKEKFYRVTMQNIRFNNMVVVIGQAYYFQTPLKVRLMLFQHSDAAKDTATNDYNKVSNAIWQKEMLFSKFKRSFQFSDHEKFRAKLENLQKALVLS